VYEQKGGFPRPLSPKKLCSIISESIDTDPKKMNLLSDILEGFLLQEE
jgi:hypothetical protein